MFLDQSFQVILFWVPCFLAGSESDLSANTQHAYKELAAQRWACGPNALYVFLGLQGEKTSALKFCAHAFHGNEKALSISELVHVASQFGHRLSARHIDWTEELAAQIEFPVIAHMLMRGSTEPGGHFVVLLGYDGDQFHYVDGTSGQILQAKFGWMRDRLTGNIIVTREPYYYTWQWWLLPACGIAIAIFVWKDIMSRVPGQRILCLFACICCYFVNSTDAGETSSSIAACGRNSAILMCYAYNVDPTPLLMLSGEDADSFGCTLHDVQELASTCGLALRVSQLAPANLRRIPTPFVTTLEKPESSRHVFCIVHFVGEDFIDFIDDSTASVHRLDKIVFLRDWSGYVAYGLARQSSSFSLAVVLGAVCAALGVGCHYSYRYFAGRRS